MYCFTTQQFCLLRMATNIWRRRGAAKRCRLSFNEETATETLLLDLAVQFPGRVKIVPFTKAEEAQTGADWAWAFVGPDGHSCQAMLVQAKRLDDLDQAYRSLNHHGGSSGSTPALSQMDRLIATAHRYRLPPIYAFYNHLDDTSRIPMNTCGTLNLIQFTLPESWGVAIAPATAVRKARPNNKFDCHRHHSRPLHCLLCSRGFGQQSRMGSAGAAAATLSEMFEGSTGEDGLWPRFALPFEPTEGLPKLFQDAERIHDEHTEHVSEPLPDLSNDFPGIGGVVIMRDSETGAHEVVRDFRTVG